MKPLEYIATGIALLILVAVIVACLFLGGCAHAPKASHVYFVQAGTGKGGEVTLAARLPNGETVAFVVYGLDKEQTEHHRFAFWRNKHE